MSFRKTGAATPYKAATRKNVSLRETYPNRQYQSRYKIPLSRFQVREYLRQELRGLLVYLATENLSKGEQALTWRFWRVTLKKLHVMNF